MQQQALVARETGKWVGCVAHQQTNKYKQELKVRQQHSGAPVDRLWPRHKFPDTQVSS